MTKQEIAAIVRPYVEAERLDDITFTVRADDILTGQGWYRVPVHPSYLPERIYRLYDVFAYLEGKIQEAEGLTVLLLIGEPLHEVKPSAASVA